jgi:hypothetical protein
MKIFHSFIRKNERERGEFVKSVVEMWSRMLDRHKIGPDYSKLNEFLLGVNRDTDLIDRI